MVCCPSDCNWDRNFWMQARNSANSWAKMTITVGSRLLHSHRSLLCVPPIVFPTIVLPTSVEHLLVPLAATETRTDKLLFKVANGLQLRHSSTSARDHLPQEEDTAEQKLAQPKSFQEQNFKKKSRCQSQGCQTAPLLPVRKETNP